jgi:hypothetical protein
MSGDFERAQTRGVVEDLGGRDHFVGPGAVDGASVQPTPFPGTYGRARIIRCACLFNTDQRPSIVSTGGGNSVPPAIIPRNIC